MSLYSNAIQHHVRQHLATLTALDRQQEHFDRIDTVAADINARAVELQAEPVYHPGGGAFIRISRPPPAGVLIPVCADHSLRLVAQGHYWLLVPAGEAEHPSIQLLLAN
ncbi:hypothetical protein CXB49_10455 [Chromobacterium sp. ATCC 53434]|uniref:hypothetical protein n=1 Tax=Chromobacterium sp. (strain ATCC 53434 / SC 14030) TaxID=2059672 RepID=UPI000C76E917|nr:hypothetical protein [Chromobacterium sp. ATCC 53434]AUH51199.1 hypothetical protein CXB49_10455 [Chromobacterium sp. ATCC 53434]